MESTQILTGGHRLISNVSRNDSDRALSLKAGTEAVLSFLQSLPTSDAVQLVANIAHVIENSMGRIPELCALSTSTRWHMSFANKIASSRSRLQRRYGPNI